MLAKNSQGANCTGKCITYGATQTIMTRAGWGSHPHARRLITHDMGGTGQVAVGPHGRASRCRYASIDLDCLDWDCIDLDCNVLCHGRHVRAFICHSRHVWAFICPSRHVQAFLCPSRYLPFPRIMPNGDCFTKKLKIKKKLYQPGTFLQLHSKQKTNHKNIVGGRHLCSRHGEHVSIPRDVDRYHAALAGPELNFAYCTSCIVLSVLYAHTESSIIIRCVRHEFEYQLGRRLPYNDRR